MTAVLPDLTNYPDASAASTSTPGPRPGSNLPASRTAHGAHTHLAGGDANHPDAIPASMPSVVARPGADSLVGHAGTAAQSSDADEGTNIRSDQSRSGAQARGVAAEQTHPDGANRRSPTSGPVPRPGDSRTDDLLGFLAAVLDDLERVRVANENRVR